jgi:hypothetical protein
MTRQFGGALCAIFGVFGLSSAYADVWITHDQILERRDNTGAVARSIPQAFGAPIGERTEHGQVDPATGNVWLSLLNLGNPGPPYVVRILGFTQDGEEIWQKTVTGAQSIEPTFAADHGRHGVWVLRAVDPRATPTSTMEAVLFDEATGARLATVRGLGLAGAPLIVGLDGAVWITVHKANGNRWVRLQGTTQELDGYKVVGATGPHHRTLPGPSQDVASVYRSDGSLFFGINNGSTETDGGAGVIVKYSAEGEELWRSQPYPFEKYSHFTAFDVDPRSGELYFTTGVYGAFLGQISWNGVELRRAAFGEDLLSFAVDIVQEVPTFWLADMPQVDDDLSPNAPMVLRRLNARLETAVAVSFPGNVTVIGAAPFLRNNQIISLDVQPQDRNNVVNLVGNTEVRVALLSSYRFDPLQTNLDTIRFGPAAATVRSSWTRDVNVDGVADLVVTFATQQTGIECGYTSATLTGETYAAIRVSGSGALRTECQ